ncbi:PhzF family phenazine biosynthesis protein [Neisseria animaloris]|uniref:PhzF family phenazine biosynthesis protein n=1 Tax=Neisseria animaloris TaxID=326522 RepID=UPI001F2FB00A|nr:PhzF family phenazine biosynthesis protein [Neisseria animaloris]
MGKYAVRKNSSDGLKGFVGYEYPTYGLLWHEQGDTVQARMFYAQNDTILEDSGTGSACANLGAYYLSHGTFPLKRSVRQGDQTGRPNRLSLRVDEAENIYVGGRVVEVGRGVFKLPR